tara:strand:- start:549 stop:1028 length:480 start_codon:yes stop_codon:yes gene_type:complete
MSEIEFNPIEGSDIKLSTEIEVDEVYPFVYTVVKENFDMNFNSSAKLFSAQMFARGTNPYVESYTTVAMPVIVEDNTIIVNKTNGFKLPNNFPYLVSWVYCDNNQFNFHIGEKKISCTVGGLIFFPSWLENTKLTVEGRFDVELRHGCCNIPLEQMEIL